MFMCIIYLVYSFSRCKWVVNTRHKILKIFDTPWQVYKSWGGNCRTAVIFMTMSRSLCNPCTPSGVRSQIPLIKQQCKSLFSCKLLIVISDSVILVQSSQRGEKTSMPSVNTRWSNYLLCLHSFQSGCWAWLNEYNPLILFCSLIRKPGSGQMWLDRCWGIMFDFFNCLLLFRRSFLSTYFVPLNKRIMLKCLFRDCGRRRYRPLLLSKNSNNWRALGGKTGLQRQQSGTKGHFI